MRTAELAALGVLDPRVCNLEALGFTVEGDPIHPLTLKDIVQLYKARRERVMNDQFAISELQRASDYRIRELVTDMATTENTLRMERLRIRKGTEEMLDASEALERNALMGSVLDLEHRPAYTGEWPKWSRADLSKLEQADLERWNDLLSKRSLKSDVAKLEAQRDKTLAELAEAEAKRDRILLEIAEAEAKRAALVHESARAEAL